MKKTLILAIAGLLGLGSLSAQTAVKGVSWNSTLTPATELKDGGKYLVYDASKLLASNQVTERRAWRKVSNGLNVSGENSTSAESGQVSYAEYVFEAVKNGDNWQFRHLGTGKYIPEITSEQKTAMPLSSTPRNWTLALNESTQSFKVKAANSSNQCWDGDPSLNMVSWSGGATNDSEAHWYQFFSVESTPVSVGNVVSITFNVQNGAVQIPSYTVSGCVGETYTVAFPEAANKVFTGTFPENTTTINVWPVYKVLPDGTKINSDWLVDGSSYESAAFTAEGVSIEAKTVTNVSAPVEVAVTLADGVRPFKFVSARYLNRWTKVVNNGLTTIVTDSSNADWLIEIPVANGIKMFDPVSCSFVKNPANSGNPTGLSANPNEAAVFAVTKVPQGAETFFADGVGFNMRNNHVAGWTGNDIGSRWFQVYDEEAFEANRSAYSDNDNNNTYYSTITHAKPLLTEALADAEYSSNETILQFSAYVTALEAARFGQQSDKTIPEMITEVNNLITDVNKLLYVSRYNRIVGMGQQLIDWGFGSESAVNAWNTAIAAIDTTDGISSEDVTAASNALTTLVPAATTVLSGTPSVQFQHPQGNKAWMGRVADGSIKRGGTDGTRTFTLKAAEGGFNIFHEYTNSYIKHPTGDIANITMVKNAADATVYTFDVRNALAGLFGVKANNVTANREYLHCNNGNDVTNIVRWEAGDNSSWYISGVSEDVAAAEHLNGAKAYYAGFSSFPQGDALGQYKIAGADNEAIESALALADDAAANDKRIAAETLFATKANLNMPQTGHFYRFQNVDPSANTIADEGKRQKNLYMSSVRNGNGIEMIVDEGGDGGAANKAETVFYLDDSNRLVALTDGLCLGQFIGGDAANSWRPLLSTNDKVAEVTFAESGVVGKYNIIPSDGRYLYGLNNTVDCGGGDAAGYRWTITEVNWVPIPGSDKNYTTICYPVALNTEGKKLNVLTAAVENGKAVLTPVTLTDNIIPANTPVVLHTEFTGTGSGDAGTTRDGSNNLVYLKVESGNATPAITEGNALRKQILATDQVSGMSVLDGLKFVAAEGTVPGFHAYLESEIALPIADADVEAMTAEGKVFTIASADGRGTLGYNAGNNGVWSSNKVQNADLTSDDYKWTMVRDAQGKEYLYNLGAGKFIGAFEAYSGAGSDKAEFGWHFGDALASVSILPYEWIKGARTVVNILGGSNAKSTRPAGMMVIANNAQHPVPAVAGMGVKDGSGFVLTAVEGATVPAELSAKLAEQIAAMADAHAVAMAYVTDENREEIAANGVGHYTAEGFADFSNAVQAATADDDAEARYYALVRGRIAAGDRVNKFTDGNVYNVEDADGNKYKAVFDADAMETSHVADGNFANTDVDYNWLAAVDANGLVTLSHKFKVPASKTRAAVTPDENGLVAHNLVESVAPEYDGMGNIKLGELAVKATDRPEKPETTEIDEITAEGNRGAEVIFDLQGRRVNKAAKGVYIVNGKKMLVK